MGMDLAAIIEHHRSPEELLELPKIIGASEPLKKLFLERHKVSNEEFDKLNKTKWAGPYEMTENNLLQIWKRYEDDLDTAAIEGMNYFADLDSYFGQIAVYKETINVSPFPEHKYGNLRNLVTSKYVFTLHRQIAKIIGANRILYCCDSYYYPSILEEKSRMGWNLNSIIEFGNRIFGIPPKEINEAVENLYFIDEFDIDLDKLDPDKKVWSRAKYEYEKEQNNLSPYKNWNLNT